MITHKEHIEQDLVNRGDISAMNVLAGRDTRISKKKSFTDFLKIETNTTERTILVNNLSLNKFRMGIWIGITML